MGAVKAYVLVFYLILSVVIYMCMILDVPVSPCFPSRHV